MANIMEMTEYDKVVRRFVDDYVNQLDARSNERDYLRANTY